MQFSNFYYKEDILMVPMPLDAVVFEGKKLVGWKIPNDMLPLLVQENVLTLEVNGKKFTQLDEAVKEFDMLTEADKIPQVDAGIKWKDKEGNEKLFKLGAGNSKVGTDTVIVNMSSATECMSRILGVCPLGDDCYALADEKRFDDIRVANDLHGVQWDCATPEEMAFALMSVQKNDSSIKYVRLNEAGEIRNLPTMKGLLKRVKPEDQEKLKGVDDILKLKQLGAILLDQGSDLLLYTYTHRRDISDQMKDLGTNIVIQGSGFMVDNAFMPLSFKGFMAVEDEIESGAPTVMGYSRDKVKQCFGSCRECMWCKVNDSSFIYLPIHGSSTEYQQQVNKLSRELKKNPEIKNIIAKDIPEGDKLEEIMALMSDDDMHLLKRLKPLKTLLTGKTGFFTKIMKTKTAQKNLFDAIAATLIKPEDFIGEASFSDQKQAMTAAVESLRGKYADKVAEAKSVAGINKWTSLQKNLEDAISMVQSGSGDFEKITGKLATHSDATIRGAMNPKKPKKGK